MRNKIFLALTIGLVLGAFYFSFWLGALAITALDWIYTGKKLKHL